MGGLSPIWHDVECAAYTADIDLWRTLAADAEAILDLGSGTGRVALDLGRRGHAVTALDLDSELVETLRSRAVQAGVEVDVHVADARAFDLARTFDLVISPMQVVQLLGGQDGRSAMLGSVRKHLAAGGRFAAALANPFDDWDDEESLPPLPDVREEDGWVYSSTPVAVRRVQDRFLIDRHRQAVSPSGTLTEEMATIALDVVTADQLEAEATAQAFAPLRRYVIPPTRDYVGSDVVVLEAT